MDRIREVERNTPPDLWPEVERRAAGPRRPVRLRPRRLGAAVVVVTVVAVFAWTVLRLVGAFEQPNAVIASSGSLRTTGWHFAYPSRWRAQNLPACPTAPSHVGIIVTDTPFAFRNPYGGPPRCGDRFVLAGFPENGVAIALMPAAFGFGIAAPTFDTPFPIAWDQLEPSGGIKGGPAESYLVIRIHGQPAWALRTWIGHEAPRTSVAEAKAVVASLLVRGASRWETYQDAARGFTVTYPADWFRARQSLLAESSSAREILSLATYRVRPGGSACAGVPLPGNALASLGLGDVFITVQEAEASLPSRFDPRSANKRWDGLPACHGHERLPLRAWWIPFEDQGREFYAFVALGPFVSHDGQVLRVAWHVLDSLRFRHV